MSKKRGVSRSSEHHAHDAMRVTVATFNARNLVMPGSGKPQLSTATYRRKRKWIAEQLERMGCPDLVAFQEVNDEDSLLDILSSERLRQYTRRGSSVLIEDNGILGIKNAVISSLPVIDWWSIAYIPQSVRDALGGHCPVNEKFLRPVLVVVVEFPGGVEVELWNVHLKSRRGIFRNGESGHSPYAASVAAARSLIVRAVEAAGVRHLYLSALAERHRPIILAGDINDVLHSVTSEILTGDDPWKRLPSSEKVEVWSRKLHDVRYVRARQRDFMRGDYSYVYNGKYLSLDLILASNHFSILNPNHIGWVESVRAFSDHLVDPTVTDLDPWVSDHGQVVATLRLGHYHHLESD